MTPPKGFCGCGCGQATTVARVNHASRGWIKGEPIRFIRGHVGRMQTGSRYREKKIGSRRSYEHIEVAERALGKPLPSGAQVHHINENRRDNRPENLVVCPDTAYHKLLHVRQSALTASGNPNYRMCWVCKQWDDPINMTIRKRATQAIAQHPECNRRYMRTHRRMKLLIEGKPIRRSRYYEGHPGGSCHRTRQVDEPPHAA
jgi:hypothetical protein